MANLAAVVGIGQTKYTTKRGDVSIAGLVREAAVNALADAELTWTDIDATVFVFVKIDGTNMSLQVVDDGSTISTNTVSRASVTDAWYDDVTEPIVVGGNQTGSEETGKFSFHGMLYRFRVYNSVISDADVTNIVGDLS